MKKIILLSVSIYLFTALSSFAQTTNNLQLPTSINDNGDPPHASTILDIQSPDKGLRIPSMTSEQRNAIPDPATGLLIYNTTDSCFNYFTGEAWYKDCGRSLMADTEPATPFQSSGAGYEEAQGIALDQSGNIYLTGRFNNTAQFGNFILTSSGGDDVFVVKVNPDGETVWAKHGAGSGTNDYGRSVCVDHEGNLLATGHYQGSITFDGTNLTTTGTNDLYVVKFDPSGALIWAKTGNTNVSAHSYDITCDDLGNIFLTGSFSGTLNLGSVTLTSVSVRDVFVIKLDSNGNTVWATSSGGTSSNDAGNGIATDHLGNVLITGTFVGGTVTFGPVTLPNSGNEDVFVVKYDPSGTVLWAHKGGGPNQDLGGDICVDGAGNVYITGIFSAQATFDPTTVTGVNEDAYVVKYRPDGTVDWVRIGTGSNSSFGDFGLGITVDAMNHILLTGLFNNDIFFDPFLLTSYGDNDIFVVKYDSLGSVIWAKSGGGYKYDAGYDIATDVSGNVFVTGFFDSTATLGNMYLSGTLGYIDALIWKLSPTGGNYLLTNHLSTSGFWNASGGDIHNANGGNVGIDEESPSHKLTIRSSINTQTMRLIGPTPPFYHGAKLNFGDADLVFINEPDDDIMRIQANRIGIRMFPATNELELNGNASKSVAGSWLANSDARLKKDIRPLDPDLMLEKMLSLQGITYEWNDNKTGIDRPKGVQYGFTAQNIRKTFPSLVEEDALGYLQTPYGTYDAMLVEAIRALYNRIQVLESENKSLLSRLDEKENQNDVQIQKIMNLLQNAGLTTEN